MVPPEEVPEAVRYFYAAMKMFGDAVFDLQPNEALEYRWAIDAAHPGELFIQEKRTSAWRRVVKRWNGSFAVFDEGAKRKLTLQRAHPMSKIMTKKRSSGNGQRWISYFDALLEMAEKHNWHRSTVHYLVAHRRRFGECHSSSRV
jgi:hypothetical protein